MENQNAQDQLPLPCGVSLNSTDDDRIRHEAGHVLLHWLIGNKPISVERTANGLITNLEQRINANEQPWQHIMSLLAGPIAEKNNSILNEITDILECMKKYVINILLKDLILLEYMII